MNKATFAQKLYIMVSDPSNFDVIRWRNEESFTVLDSVRLANEVLRKHFQTSNFTSFVRQLSAYNFYSLPDRRERKSSGPFSFRHRDRLFMRDRLDLIPLITRRKDKRVSARRSRRKRPLPDNEADDEDDVIDGGDDEAADANSDMKSAHSSKSGSAATSPRASLSMDPLELAESVVRQQVERIAELKALVAKLELQVQMQLGRDVAPPPPPMQVFGGQLMFGLETGNPELMLG